MKKLLVGLVILLALSGVSKAGETRMMFRDYSPLDFVGSPLGVGYASWTDSDEDFASGVYGQIALISWRDKVRLNFGAVASWKDSKDRVELRPHTSISTLIPIGNFDLEIGGYYAPFWGLEPRTDDPYGVMIGLGFGLGDSDL